MLTLAPLPTTLWTAPHPILFNSWKHHAGWLREAIRNASVEGPPGLEQLAQRLVVMGTELMDLYHGDLPPATIGSRVLEELATRNLVDAVAFRAWVGAGGGYQTVTLPEDGCLWVLRMGEDTDRFIHVHPGRYAPHTRRVRANVLKTAVLVLAHAGCHQGTPLDRHMVNRVRKDYLGLSPVGHDLAGDQGLGAVIDLLRG